MAVKKLELYVHIPFCEKNADIVIFCPLELMIWKKRPMLIS